MRYVAEKKVLRSAGLIAVASIFGVSAARGVSISNGNSTLTFNTVGMSGPTIPYIADWIVEGVDVYGAPTKGETPGYVNETVFSDEYINDLTLVSSSFAGATATTTYQGSGFSITTTDVLDGGSSGSGNSAIQETIKVTNTGDQALAFFVTDRLSPNSSPTGLTLTTTTNTASFTNSAGATILFKATPTPNLLSVSTNGDIGPFLDLPPGTSTGNVVLAWTWGDESDETSPSLGVGASESFTINESVSGVTPITSAVPLPNAAESALATMAGLGAYRIVRRFRKSIIA
jgi:hypothetical protein